MADEVGVRLRVRDARKFNEEMRRSGKSVRDFGLEAERADKRASRSSKSFGKQAVGAGAIARAANVGALSLGAMAAATIKFGADFEQKMAQVRAISGATGAQFTSLRDLALEQGQATKFSASESASAMYELASAGIPVGQMAATLKGTLSLAAASGIDLASAAEIQANALKGFGLAGDQATHVADVLAQVTADSSVKMTDLQYSMKYIGPIAVATGQSFETMAAALGIMGDAGIKGEQAGTSIRGGLLRLVKPTKQVRKGFEMMGLQAADFYGPKGLKPLPEILNLIRLRTAGMTAAQRNQAVASIFGTEALTGMQSLLNTQPGLLEQNIKRYEGADGAAKRMARTMNDTVSGSFEQATGAAQTLAIELFAIVSPTLKSGLHGLTDAFTFLGDHATITAIAVGLLVGSLALFYTVKGVIFIINGISAALAFLSGLCLLTRIQLAALWIQETAMTIATWLWAASAWGAAVAVGALDTALAILLSPIALVILAVLAIVGVFILLYNKVGWFRDGVDAAWTWIKNAAMDTASWVINAWNNVVNFISALPGRIAGAAKGMWDGIKDAFRAAVNWILSKWNNLAFHVGGTDLGPLGHLPSYTINTPDIPLLAKGGIIRSVGAAVVGDQGPELLTMMPGARVDPLPRVRPPRVPTLGRGEVEALGDFDTRDLFGPQEFHLYIEGREIAVAVKRVAEDDTARR